MHPWISAPLLLLVLNPAVFSADYPCRWVYVSHSLRRDTEVAEVQQIVRTASEHGLNGMVLSAGLDRLDRQSPEYLANLEKVQETCRESGVEIIPILFSAGYGGAVLGEDRNLAAGLPVNDVPFVVEGQTATFRPDASVEVPNGGFEVFSDNRFEGCRFHDRPGETSFVDTETKHSGKASLRMENFDPSHGHGRVMFEVSVQPHRCYRLRCWFKTDSLQPAGGLQIQVLAGERSLAPMQLRLEPTMDWREVVVGFNSLEFDKVRIYAGVWGGRSGRFWIDDLRVEETALVNVLRRPGTPLVVRDAASGTVYEEGRDFAPLADPRLNFRFDHDGPKIELLSESRIKDGQQLRVSYYHGMAINDGQVSVCMSEPKTYEIWKRQAELVQRHLAPKRWLLSMDEIRAGGSCKACKDRGLSMAQILGDCITRQVEIIRGCNPAAEIYCWSDMLDPNHNAHGDYYLVEGDYSGSWNYVPKDLRIVCWYHKVRRESLKHFSGLGFQTLAGAYYDADTLDNPRDWLEALAETPGAQGIMYTTWQNKYALLAPFGDLVSGK
ncbi:MAG: hypothetical protein ACYC6Y_00180 [Thermoguttaceae bacterium]